MVYLKQNKIESKIKSNKRNKTRLKLRKCVLFVKIVDWYFNANFVLLTYHNSNEGPDNHAWLNFFEELPNGASALQITKKY